MKPKIINNAFCLGEIPHKGNEISIEFPGIILSTEKYEKTNERYENIKNGITRIPTPSENASIFYDAWKNSKEKYALKTIEFLQNNKEQTRILENMFVFYLFEKNNGIEEGVIFDKNPSFPNINYQNEFLEEDGLNHYNLVKDSLIEKLLKGDKEVTFVPKGFKEGKQSIDQLLENPYMLARYGSEGTKKIAKICENHKELPQIEEFFSLEGKYNLDKDQMGIASIDCSFNGGLEFCTHDYREPGAFDDDCLTIKTLNMIK